jgi:hypothetical protein
MQNRLAFLKQEVAFRNNQIPPLSSSVLQKKKNVEPREEMSAVDERLNTACRVPRSVIKTSPSSTMQHQNQKHQSIATSGATKNSSSSTSTLSVIGVDRRRQREETTTTKQQQQQQQQQKEETKPVVLNAPLLPVHLIRNRGVTNRGVQLSISSKHEIMNQTRNQQQNNNNNNNSDNSVNVNNASASEAKAKFTGTVSGDDTQKRTYKLLS